MKRFLIAAAALTMVAAPAAMAQSHYNRGGHGGYAGGHAAQRYGGHGYQPRWYGGHSIRSNWGGQHGGFGYNDYRPRREHYERRSHLRPRHYW